MYTMHDNAMTSGYIKDVTKHPIVITWWAFMRKIPTQRKTSKAAGTEKADISCFYSRRSQPEK